MDIFPTFLAAAGGDPAEYDLDGLDVMPMLAEGAPSPHGPIFWEQGDQIAMREGPWKLVLRGQLVEGAPPEDEVHLANLDDDPGETTNLVAQEPERAAAMVEAAEAWRSEIEQYWIRRYAEAKPATAGRAT